MIDSAATHTNVECWNEPKIWKQRTVESARPHTYRSYMADKTRDTIKDA